MIKNPVIRGFNPDPSMIRIGDTYYLATSTFQWWPGVEIYESKDLEHWKRAVCPLNDPKRHDMHAVPDGGGVWAPCISYDGKKVYLVYTIVKERGATMQTDNYLITAEDIKGEWSDPIYLNSMGFDPSLFHDTDGRKYLLNLDNHYLERFNGLWLTEFDEKSGKLIGSPKKIYSEKSSELVEGAHIYHLNGWYYLLKAQGGTGVKHSAQMSRSKSLWGPYEDDEKIIIHSRNNPELYIQTAGHADIVETTSGWAMCHLGTRKGLGICGRETCMQSVYWTEDGWLRLSGGGENPKEEFDSGLKEHLYETEAAFCDFKKGEIPSIFKSLREPLKTEFTDRGVLLNGGAGPLSRFDQSILAMRIDEEEFYAETKVYFEPKSEKQLAGLIMYYDSNHWQLCHMTLSPEGKREIRLIVCDKGELTVKKRAEYDKNEAVFSAEIKDGTISYFANGEKFDEADALIISDTHMDLGFTGAMAGICCIDMYRREEKAEFEYFKWGKDI